MRNNIAYLAAAISLLISPSCGKKSSGNTSPCQIVSITDQNATRTIYDITYDSTGRISTEQFVSNGVTTNRVFTYRGSTVLKATSAGAFASLDSITLNRDGMIVSDYYSDNTDSTSSMVNTYSGLEVQSQVLTAGSGAPQTTSFIWNLGDMDYSSVGSGANSSGTYSYNDSTSKAGDYWQLIQLLNYGAIYLKTTHQLTGYQYGSTDIGFSYQYDNTGKITVLTAVENGNVESINYQYTCK